MKIIVFDSTFSNQETQLDFIAREKPFVVAIYTNLMTKITVIKLIKLLIADPKYGFPKIILGGPDVTFNTQNYLDTGAHFLIIGEGEQTIAELYQSIRENSDYSSITGIAYKENNSVIKTPPRIKIKDLSQLPLPNREGD